jgi:hypothetical protein
MATRQEDFDALMARLNTITNDIAADYAQLLDEIKNNTVSAESIANGNANVATLEALGASVANPVPPPVEPIG